MKKRWKYGVALILLATLLMAGCSDTESPIDTDTESMTATATETNADTDTNTNTEEMTDMETHTQIEDTGVASSETDSQTEPASDIDVTSANLLYALSDTGLEVIAPQDATSDKQVGLFYFIWQGTENEQSKIYDNTEIFANLDLTGKEGLTLSEWQAAGGGPKGDFHWWGQPLFGYYDMMDEWVISRHFQMFAQAGIDFIVIDQTNGVRNGYIDRITTVFEVAYELQQQGVRVPKIAFMAYDDGPTTVDKLYYYFYFKHPEWSELFYHWNDHEKPVMFDNITGYSKDASYKIDQATKLASYDPAVTAALEIRDVAFPHETKTTYKGTGLLYLDFRSEPRAVVDKSDGGYSFINVSVAEICGTNRSTENIFAETTDRSRNWDGEKNLEWHGVTDAWRYGYNFARQWEVALEKSPDMVFITGWNEWIAQLQVRASDNCISLIDNADINNSRDIEPMSGGYGDNYYLQMCQYITKFKYGNVALSPSGSTSVDMQADATAWEQDGVLSYADPIGDGAARDHQAASVSSIIYTTPAADNDISRIYVAADDSATYFRVDTAEAVKDAGKDGNLVLLVKTGDKTYAVNRTGGTATTCVVEELVDGAWNKLGEATCRIEGNSLSVAVPTDLIPNGDALYIKWVDGLSDPSDRMAYYTCPEAAPYGGLFLAFRK